MNNKKISIDVNGIQLHFSVSLTAYNKYINDLTQTNKVQPAFNFVSTCAEKNEENEDKVAEILKQPGAGLHIASVLVEEYQPDFDITVKK